MKKKQADDRYLDAYVHLLELSLKRAQEDLVRERKRVDFLEGKCERLELVVMEAKNDAGRSFVERSDRAAEPSSPRRKPPIEKVPAAVPTRVPFSQVRDTWNSLSEAEQEKAIESGNLEVKPKENTA